MTWVDQLPSLLCSGKLVAAVIDHTSVVRENNFHFHLTDPIVNFNPEE